ncbi:MAG: hypothetical protein Q9173_000674 [Seirophora scorigena]
MQVSGKEKPEGLFIPDWEDERGRLRMWAANIGAHQTGQSSLEFRLRDSSHIQQQIIRLLENLAIQLEDARTVLTEGENSDEESIIGSDSGDEETLSEFQQLRSSVASLISCLFEISILVRKPGRHDVRTESKDIDFTAYEWADLRHVRDKFPRADDKVTARLGQAITQRRKYLRYRERHAAKLRQGIDRDVELTGQPSRSEVLSETVATNFRDRSVEEDSHDNTSDSGFTQTSYASTLTGGSRVTVPAAPEASTDGAPFECPYCYCIVTAPNSRSWWRHVFNDLEPYVCVDIDCKTPNTLYTTRHEWLHHMKTAHRHHENEKAFCALCENPQENQANLGRHVAQHLQELALFILPKNEASSDKDITDAKSDSSSSRSLSASALHQSEQKEPLFISTDDVTDDTVAAGDFGTPADEVAKVAGRATGLHIDEAGSTKENYTWWDDDELVAKAPRSRTSSHLLMQDRQPAQRELSDTQLTTPAPNMQALGTQSSSSNSIVSSEAFKTSFRMVIHLPDEEIRQRICCLDTASGVDVISHDVVKELRLKKVKYPGPPLYPFGGFFLPEWQVTFDWHVAKFHKTYTTTFVVLDEQHSKSIEVVLGKSTISKIGFYTKTSYVW